MRRAVCLALMLVACGTGQPAANGSPQATPSTVRTAPLARGYSSMVDGYTSTGVLLFGGFAGHFPHDYWQPDLWSYSKASGWMLQSAVAPEIPPGDGFGYTTTGKFPIFVDAKGTTWAFNAAGTRWQAGTRGVGPIAHGSHMVYDSKADRFVLYGGAESGFDTLTYNAYTDTWTTLKPTNFPHAKSYYASAYDPKVDRVVLFGGLGAGETSSETWIFDFDNDAWTQLKPRSSPPAREYGAMVYDSVGDRLLLFGGAGPGEAALDDLWAYSFATNAWTEIKPVGTQPGARAWHAMAFDHETGTAVVFGGGPSRDKYNAEVWLFDSRTNTWSRGAS